MGRRAWVLLTLLALIVVGWAVLQTPFLRSARSVAWTSWTATVGRAFRIGPLTIENNVAEQLAKLQAENTRLKTELIDYGRIKEQLGAPAYEGFMPISAEVLANPADPFHASFVINRGTKDGMVLGAPVLVFGSTLVGFISELHEHTAVLRLMFHPETSLAVDVLAGEMLYRGLASGQSFTAAGLGSVPRDAPLQAGQQVVSASLPGLVPAGLSLGEIMAIEDEPHEPFQRARIKVPYDADRLYAVTVLVSR